MEPVAVLEIVIGVVVVHDVDLGFGRDPQHRDQRRYRRVAFACDGFFVGRDQRALVQRHALRPEEQLGRAQHVRVVAAVERVAQDHVDELVDEQVRGLGAAPHQIEIGRFQRAVAGQVIAEGEHDLPVLARVGVGDGGDLARRDRSARFGQQRRMQRALGRDRPPAAAPAPAAPDRP